MNVSSVYVLTRTKTDWWGLDDVFEVVGAFGSKQGGKAAVEGAHWSEIEINRLWEAEKDGATYRLRWVALRA